MRRYCNLNPDPRRNTCELPEEVCAPRLHLHMGENPIEVCQTLYTCDDKGIYERAVLQDYDQEAEINSQYFEAGAPIAPIVLTPK